MKSGIYKITHNRIGYTYIGKSVDAQKRLKNHRSALDNGNHHNLILQRDWNIFQSDEFSFEVIEYVPVDRLDEREQYWINHYSKICFLYNKTFEGNQANTGKPLYKWAINFLRFFRVTKYEETSYNARIDWL